MKRVDSLVNDSKISLLSRQAARQQWVADDELDFSTEIALDEKSKKVWGEISTVFYTLEKLGLNVLTRMFVNASQKFHSDETLHYLTLQCADESRHVAVIEKYMEKLGCPARHDARFNVLSRVASWGPVPIENWLFSTLFSENFASAFLRRAKSANIDPLGAEMCRRILIDESRHIHFLNIVLPDVLDRMGVFKKSYVKLSQRFIIGFTTKMSAQLADSSHHVGIERRDLLEEVFENVSKTYEHFGVTRDFLRFPKIH